MNNYWVKTKSGWVTEMSSLPKGKIPHPETGEAMQFSVFKPEHDAENDLVSWQYKQGEITFTIFND